MSVRTRIEPAPSGSIHVGNARTALFNWLFARHHGGAFVLRIEDTDRSRSTEENIDFIVDALAWLGLEWDEGPPTAGYRQTERLDLYRDHALRLLRMSAPEFTQEVEQALARQSAYGGDLLTNLLEVVPLPEERIAAVLSETFGLEPAPLGELPKTATGKIQRYKLRASLATAASSAPGTPPTRT